MNNKVFLVGLFIPLIMAVINVSVEILIGFASTFTRPVNETKNIIANITGISAIQFINLGLILVFVSIDFKLDILGITNPPGILQGKFMDFTSGWYNKVGSQIVMTMIIEIVAPHGLPLVLIIYYGIVRCYDRGCTRDKRKTKQLIQYNYEQIYIGPEFTLDNRLAQIVALVWVTFLFSTGLPIIIVVTLANLIAMFWIDKYLLLRFYQTPKNWDDTTIKYTISLLKWTFVFHFAMGMLMLSNSDILADKVVMVK